MKDETNVKQLIDQVRSAEESERQKALEAAKAAGPQAVAPLAEAMSSESPEVARAASRALWNLVHAQGAPGAEHQRQTGAKLVSLLGPETATEVRREILWMVSELCDTNQAVRSVAAVLEDPTLKEDARTVLERLPGKPAVAALKAGFVSADRDFKYALAASLRKRGARVKGYPSQRLLPTRMKPQS